MYVMSIYHILIPVWMHWFGFNKPMTFAVIDPAALASSENIWSQINLQSSFVAISWAVIIVTMDMFFLASLKWHFHHAKFQLVQKGTTNLLTVRNIFLVISIVFSLVFYFNTPTLAIITTVGISMFLTCCKYCNFGELHRSEAVTVNFLSWTNITRLEVLVFFVSLYSVALREIMMFLSINTIQITIAYVLMSRIPFGLGRVLMISAAYSFLVKLLLFPLGI